MPTQDIATGYYLKPGVMTAPGSYQPLLADLPRGGGAGRGGEPGPTSSSCTCATSALAAITLPFA
jgi:hypothetical protein